MPRILILATTTGYQTRAFGEAAERLGAELVFATDRCHLIDDPWQDGAVPIRFHEEDASVAAIVRASQARPVDGVIAVGDRPTVIAARVAETLGLPWHPPAAAAVAKNKQLTRERLRAAGLPVPWFVALSLQSRIPTPESPSPNAQSPVPNPQSPVPNPQSPSPNPQSPIPNPQSPLSFPCVVKPAGLSGSRGVMRADDERGFAAAVDRLQALLRSPDVRAERGDVHDVVLVEGFIPGREFALECLMHRGELRVLAIFDKPDPLDGPFFEETIYVTPSQAPDADQRAIVDAVARAARAIGLRHGPVHAECRVNAAGVFVLEVAARPIGGLCAQALRFTHEATDGSAITFEELLLRHAVGEAVDEWQRERQASGVMMIPIPRRGIYRGVEGVEAARGVANVHDVRITAKADQLLVPLPEGASYLGFIFARADSAAAVDRALRAAHAQLRFAIDPELLVLNAAQINYNSQHG